MKITIRDLIVTAVLLILCCFAWLFMPSSISIWGVFKITPAAIVNALLIFGTMYCGLACGIIMAIMIPILEFAMLRIDLVSKVPLLLPCMMLSNIVFVLVAWFIRGKRYELNVLPVSLILGSFLKAIASYLLIIKLLLPHYLKVVTASQEYTYSSAQFYGALLGSILIWIIWPLVKLIKKKHK